MSAAAAAERVRHLAGHIAVAIGAYRPADGTSPPGVTLRRVQEALRAVHQGDSGALSNLLFATLRTITEWSSPINTDQDLSTTASAAAIGQGGAVDRLMLNSKQTGAALGGVSVQTVIRLIDAGELRARKVGGQWMVHRDDLEAYAAGQEHR